MEENAVFFLQFKTFKENNNSYWQKLRNGEHFCDVTLACVDYQINAHKFVLSASSPVLEKILISNPHSNPLIYLKGVKEAELINLLDFMYIGEVTIRKEQLNDFLEVANDLKVRGLSSEKIGCLATETKKENKEPDSQDIRETPLSKINIYEQSKNDKDLCVDNQTNADAGLDDMEMKKEKFHDKANDLNISLNGRNKKAKYTEEKAELLLEDITEMTTQKRKSTTFINDYPEIDSINCVLDDIDDEPNILELMQSSNESSNEGINNEDIKNPKLHELTIDAVIPKIRTGQMNKLSQYPQDGILCNNTEEVLPSEMNAQIILSKSTHFDNSGKSGENKFNDVNNLDFHQDKIIEDKNTYKDENIIEINKNVNAKETIQNNDKVEENKYSGNNKRKKFPLKCAQCDYTSPSGDMSNLKRHKRTMHGEGGVWYFCKDCDYSHADKSTLKKHIYSKHERISHPCEQCGEIKDKKRKCQRKTCKR